MMDKDFEEINKIYLNQNFNFEESKATIERCQQTARAYALTENAIVSMGDNISNRSFCFFGGLADVLGLSDEERKPEIPSLYEDFIFSRVAEDDLAMRHGHELAFLNLTHDMSEKERRDYYFSDFLRIKDKDGKIIWIEHRFFPLAATPNGSYWLNMCVYTMKTVDNEVNRIVNTRSGWWKPFSTQDYAGILSDREVDVLRLMNEGLQSKEIAGRLFISTNTVNRHRQNIFQKLKVANVMEACKVGRVMGLIA